MRAPFIKMTRRGRTVRIKHCLTISAVSFSPDRQFKEESLDKNLSELVWYLHRFWTHCSANNNMTSNMTFWIQILTLLGEKTEVTMTAKVGDSSHMT